MKTKIVYNTYLFQMFNYNFNVLLHMLNLVFVHFPD